MLKRLALAAAALLTLASAPAIAASCPSGATNCYNMLDGNKAPQVVRAIVLGDGTLVQVTVPSDATGTPYSSSNPSFTQLVGSSVGVSALPAIPAGTNAIGTVGVTALPALPSGSNNIGTVGLTGTLPAFAATPTFNLGTSTALGNTADTAPANPSVAGSIIAKLSGIWQALITRLPLDTNGNLKIAMFDQNGANVTYGGTTSVTQAGTVGTDASVNAPAIPNVGANFGATGPYANYVLVKTIAAGVRNNLDIENTSGGQIVVVRDDGTAAAGAAPANASLIPLAALAGAVSGQQGGGWTSATFKGRAQIYAPSASVFVTAFTD